MAKKLVPTTARQRRKSKFFMHQVNSNLVVKMKSLSMTTMVMEGLIPLPLMKAAAVFEDTVNTVNRAIGESGAKGAVQALADLPPGATAESLEFLRHYAVVAVVEPVLTMVEDDDPDHLAVTELDAEELMNIFYATPPVEQGEEEEKPLSQEQATEFRGPERAEPVAPDPLPSEGVRPTAKLLDLPFREARRA